MHAQSKTQCIADIIILYVPSSEQIRLKWQKYSERQSCLKILALLKKNRILAKIVPGASEIEEIRYDFAFLPLKKCPTFSSL